MQSSMELYVDVGARKSFNFLHLTLQEYLAAYHISTFSLHKQIECFNEWKDGDTKMVVTFLAGLSPSAFKKSLTDVHPESSMVYNEDDIRRLFEADIQPPHEKIGFEQSIHSPFTSYMLGYLIANSSCHWEVAIRGTGIRETIRMFVSGISNGQSGAKLDLLVRCDEFSVSSIAELNNAALTIGELHFAPKNTIMMPVNNVHADIDVFFSNLSMQAQTTADH